MLKHPDVRRLKGIGVYFINFSQILLTPQLGVLLWAAHALAVTKKKCFSNHFFFFYYILCKNNKCILYT